MSLSGSERNHLFLNEGGRYDDVSALSGLDDIADSRGFALLDYDRDGFSDVALVNTNAPLVELFRNEIGDGGRGGRVLAIAFVGGNRTPEASDRWSNRDGYGALVSVHVAGRTLVREHRSGEGFAAQNSKRLLVGLGERDRAERVTVRWPSGVVQEVRDVAAGSELVFHENPADAPGGEAVSRLVYRRAPARLPAKSPVAVSPRLELATLESFDGAVPTDAAAAELRMYTTMATWCPACKRNIPQVRHLRGAFPTATLGIYGVPIDADDSVDMLAAYEREYRPGYWLLAAVTRAEVAAVQGIVREALGDEVLPTSIVTDRSGRILDVIAGVPNVSQLRRLLRRAAPDG